VNCARHDRAATDWTAGCAAQTKGSNHADQPTRCAGHFVRSAFACSNPAVAVQSSLRADCERGGGSAASSRTSAASRAARGGAAAVALGISRAPGHCGRGHAGDGLGTNTVGCPVCSAPDVADALRCLRQADISGRYHAQPFAGGARRRTASKRPARYLHARRCMEDRGARQKLSRVFISSNGRWRAGAEALPNLTITTQAPQTVERIP